MIDIRPVRSKREMEQFIDLPNRLQARDPAYVAPLKIERRQALSPKTNPFFNYAETAFWLAWQDGKPVGRISAQSDRRLPGLGQFGMLIAEDDPEIFQRLFSEAENWNAARGLTRIQGPFDLSINEEVGTLVDGFETPPMLLMPHNPRYLGARIEEQGYGKVKDIYAYLYDLETGKPRWLQRMDDRKPPDNVVLRHLDWKQYDRDLAIVVDIFNDAWSGNWGFLPLGNDEMETMAKSMKPLIHQKLVQIAELDGEPVGFAVCLPNLNEAIRDLGGNIAPCGWMKLLWRLKVAGVGTGRVPLMGFKRKIAKTPLGNLIPFMVMNRLRDEALKLGLKRIEMSWILEDNNSMRRLGEGLAGKPYKTYRIYEKALAALPVSP